MRRSVLLFLSMAVLAGCQPTLPGTSVVKPPKKGAKSVVPSPSPSTGATTNQAIAALETQRRVDLTAADQLGAVKLIGKVKLISDKGLGIISNNSGGLVSNNGAGVVSNGGGNYRVSQAGGTAAVPEALLADAAIEILDGQGRLLVGADGKPLGATSDATGNYVLNASLPKENLVLRVRLYQGGQLFAMLPRDRFGGESALPIDTASSLGASYVLERYVQKRTEVFNKLPASEADKLRTEMEGAIAQLAGRVPSYQPKELVSTTEELRGKVTTLDTALKRIEAILLAGQQDLGNGLAANQVALGLPYAVAGDPAGGFYLVEWVGGRIRKVDAAGKITTIAGIGAKNAAAESKTWGALSDIALRPDGSVIVAGAVSGTVWSLAKDGKVTKLAGTTRSEVGTVDSPAATTGLNHPRCLALAPDGTIYLGEYPTEASAAYKPGRLLKITPDGMLRMVPLPASITGKLYFTGLACDAAGALYMTEFSSPDIHKLTPGGTWESIPATLSNGTKRLTIAPDGTIFVSDFQRHIVRRISPDGQTAIVAGSSVAGHSGDGPATAAKLYEPSGLWLAADGTLMFADSGNGLIRSLGKDGTLKTVAGTLSATVQGDALSLAVNSPSAVAIDSQGRLVVTETTGSTIKRLEERVLTVIAGGGGKGTEGDGGPAKNAQFDFPSGIAFHGDVLYVSDGGNGRVRKIDAAGIITTVAGNGGGERSEVAGGPHPATTVNIGRPALITVDANGLPVWTDFVNSLVMRLRADGKVEVVAGKPPLSASSDPQAGDEGDGGAATQALLSRPVGLAYDKAGNLFVADTGNMRIRKIAPDGTITAFAGLPLMQSLTQLGTNKPPVAGAKALETAIAAPAGLVFDAAGNMYVSALGTRNLSFFGQGDSGGEIPTGLLPQVPPSILKITPTGLISVIAGPGGKVLTDPDGEDALQVPSGLAIDREGRLVIVDTGANQIRLLPKDVL